MSVKTICDTLKSLYGKHPVPIAMVGEILRIKKDNNEIEEEDINLVFESAVTYIRSYWHPNVSRKNVMKELLNGYADIDVDKQALIYLSKRFFKFMHDCMEKYKIVAPSIHLTKTNKDLINKYNLLDFVFNGLPKDNSLSEDKHNG